MEKKRSEFGIVVSGHLTKTGSNQLSLANSLGRSTSYVNQTITGRKLPSANWADLVADVLNLPDNERQRLHAAAAKDHGFKLDLTKKE